MAFCVENNFDILLTIDKNLMFQQNSSQFPVTIVVFDCITSKLEESVTFLPSFNLQVDKLQKHQSYLIQK